MDPIKLTLEEKDNYYLISALLYPLPKADEKGNLHTFLKTPGGNIVKSKSRMLIKNIVLELQKYDDLKIKAVNDGYFIEGGPLNENTLYSTICFQIDSFKKDSTLVRNNQDNKKIFYDDFILASSEEVKDVDQTYHWKDIIEFLAKKGHNFWQLQKHSPDYSKEKVESLIEDMSNYFDSLSESKKAVFVTLEGFLNSSITTWAFLENEISIEGVGNVCVYRSGTTEIDETTVSEEDKKNLPKFLYNTITNAVRLLERYLELSEERNPILELIQIGETNLVEFKATFSAPYGPVKDSKKNPRELQKEIEGTTLKTIVGFLNTNGGKILIGVTDDKKIIGIEEDKFENEDKYVRNISEKIKTRIGNQYSDKINIKIEKVNNKFVCIIECEKTTKEVFLDEDFYVRTGARTDILTGPKMLEYIKQRKE